ncbi:uncharacterized protein LOC125428376 isoform X1 [Sphaerodactylus townsendi]|uniref:uncharacterized protein LOC125428376 isoform X1 n=1 Tax=Sphaerodactylus townsendi TaxID=933632 RepID=UPI00202600D5|nr:uncharacterized protein LOC125428376 isoform X1 [Sphaerodactylus townsendi]
MKHKLIGFVFRNTIPALLLNESSIPVIFRHTCLQKALLGSVRHCFPQNSTARDVISGCFQVHFSMVIWNSFFSFLTWMGRGICRMVLYLSFPVAMFWISNQAEYFEEYVIKRKREIYPPEDEFQRKELEAFKERIRKKQEEQLLLQRAKE